MSVEVVQQISCDENLIAAYIDGELEAERIPLRSLVARAATRREKSVGTATSD